MRKFILIAILCTASLFVCASASADSFLVDGIAYETLSESTVKVVPITGFKYYGKIVIPETITDGDDEYSVVEIGRTAFEGCICLTDIVLPNTLTSIGVGAFSGCQNLKAITLPESLEKIGAYAFSNCKKLTKIVFPGSIEAIPMRCCEGCSSITSVTIGKSVTSIESNAFSTCGMQSITIPANVTNISDFAFSKCDKLSTVKFADKEKVKVGRQAFSGTPYEKSTSTRGSDIKNDPRFKVKKTVLY